MAGDSPGATAQAAAPEACRTGLKGGDTVFSQAELAQALGCGVVDLQELQQDAAREVAAALAVDPRDQLETHRIFRRSEEADMLAIGRWVTLQGLQAAHLNSRQGLIVQTAGESGRLGVQLAGFGNKLVKLSNLAPLLDEETIKVARLFCRGERQPGVQTWRWPLAVLHDRAHEASPLAERLGLPLRVTRVEPHRALRTEADYDNPWLGHLMVDPLSGYVRRPWHYKPGPALVWRADGAPLSADDLCLVICFIDGLLARYRDKEHPIDVNLEVTPESFCRFKERELAEENDPDRGRWWEDINL